MTGSEIVYMRIAVAGLLPLYLAPGSRGVLAGTLTALISVRSASFSTLSVVLGGRAVASAALPAIGVLGSLRPSLAPQLRGVLGGSVRPSLLTRRTLGVHPPTIAPPLHRHLAPPRYYLCNQPLGLGRHLRTTFAASPYSHLPRRTMSTKTTPPSATSSPLALYRQWTAAQPEPSRFSALWWWVWTIRFVVFGITGSSSVYFVRPFMKEYLGLEGSLIHGPWQYQLGSIVFVTPIYTLILVCVATVAGQQAYFMTVVRRMWGRIIPGLRAKSHEGGKAGDKRA